MRDTIAAAYKEAMKAREQVRVATLRLISSTLKDRDIEARGAGKEPLSNEDILAMLQKMVKQRQESAKIYSENGRPELAEQENAEIAIITSFLPQQLTEDETKAAIAAIINETGAAGMKDMGKVMGELKARFTGKIDFAKAGGVVKELLK